MGGRMGGVMPGVLEPGLAPGAVPSPATRNSPFPRPEPSFRETSRPRETARAESFSAPGVASSSDASHPWPEPPELPSPETGDPLAVLRDWERLRRLEREQRGE